jgi:hypothetical protein
LIPFVVLAVVVVLVLDVFVYEDEEAKADENLPEN